MNHIKAQGRRHSSTRKVLTGGLGPAGASLMAVSVISNLLMLTGPLFMLQVYDRVLPSRSEHTLVTLFTLVAGLYCLYAVVEAMRGRTMSKIARVVDDRLTTHAFRDVVQTSQEGRGDAGWAIRHTDTVRSFVASPGPLAFLDLPWTPIYIALIWGLHPSLGWLAIGSLAIVIALMVITEISGRTPMKEANQARAGRDQLARDVTSNADAAAAMGMSVDLEPSWRERNNAYADAQQTAIDRAGALSSVTKATRLLVQSAVLAVGAALVIDGAMSPGVMIAASIITARALAPVEQLVAHWRPFLAFRAAAAELNERLDLSEPGPRTQLPRPTKSLAVNDLAILAPGGDTLLSRGIAFSANAGDAIGVIGPSGIGKSSLVRVLAAARSAASGQVRLDGTLVEHYGGQKKFVVGYLPQDLDLFSGSVADNIARFDTSARDEEVVAAALAAGAHEMIARLPDGYETQVGDRGQFLSAGQRQRIGLARALFRDPFMVILDEPNSNLDVDGDMALAGAINRLRARGAVVVVVTHRPSTLAEINLVLCLNRDGSATFGPKETVLARTTRTLPNRSMI